jgi:hypothetical protein
VAGPAPVLGVIPAYNEERSLEILVRRVLHESTVQQVVIVDDCSTDGTLAAARRCAGDSRVTVKTHPQLTASLLGGSGDSQGALTHEQLPGDKG